MNKIVSEPIVDPQATLQSYIGNWEGQTRTWFEPDKLANESSWQARIHPVLGGRYLQYDYTGSLQGEPFEGKALIGYNAMSKQFEMAWIDSFHQNAGIMHCKGEPSPTGFSVLGSYSPFEGGEESGWRTTFELVDADHLTIRAYNVEPSGAESLGIETLYTRS